MKILDKCKQKNKCCIVVGTITRLLMVRLNGTPLPWLEMRLGEIQNDEAPLNYLCFKLDEKRRYYIPLGWGGWTVAKRLLLMCNPMAVRSNHTLFLYNHRIKWEITDRWPATEGGNDDSEDNLANGDAFLTYHEEEIELARITQLENVCMTELPNYTTDDEDIEDDAAHYNSDDSDYND